MKVVNSPVEGNGKKKALLDDAPSSNVYSQLQKLTAQNPVCEYFSSHFRVLPTNKVAEQNMHSFPPSFLQSGKNLFCILCETKSAAKLRSQRKEEN